VVKDMSQSTNAGDPHHLDRFVEVQKKNYEQALSEIKRGRKRSHWMWYIFLQFDGLADGLKSQKYSIKSIAEAKAYLSHLTLGPRLTEITMAALSIEGKSAHEIFDSPDNMKLKSCATLFAHVSPAGSVFEQMLDKLFQGEHDSKTLRLLSVASKDT